MLGRGHAGRGCERTTAIHDRFGPAGGVIGTKFLADARGHCNVIATDAGGASFDFGCYATEHR